MNTVFGTLNHPLMHMAGRTLLHSLWQGALVGVVFGTLRFAMRRRSANLRYLASCLCLVALVAAPLWTLIIAPVSSPSSGPGVQVGAILAGTGASTPSVAGLGRSSTRGGRSWFFDEGADFFARLGPVLASVWILGVGFFSVRLTRGFWWVRTIRTRDHEPVDAGWIETLNDLRCRLGVSRPVRLLKSALVEVPTVIGWVRPVILLPAATLTGLTPRQLETILAHELAHVRRLDCVVNAFQCLVETLMFYHPAAWWISTCIREERENCCDDLVIKVCGDRVGYARALATLEGLRAELPEWAFAASGGSLLNRIRRLVGLTNDKGHVTAREVSGLALLGIGLVLIVVGVWVLASPTTYQAAARIRINHEQQDTSGWGNPRISPGYDPYFIQTEFEVIQSEAVLGKVIRELDLNKQWGKKYAGDERLRTYETMMLLRSKLECRPVRNTSLIEIRVSSDKPEEAARIANAIAETYQALRSQQRLQLSQSGLKELEDRFQEQEEKVKKAQQQVDKLRVELNINDVSANAESPAPLMTAETLRKLESLRIESKAEYVRQDSLWKHLKALQQELGPEGLAPAISAAAPDAVLSSYVEHLGAAEQQLVGLNLDFGPQHAEVIKVKSQIEDLHSRISNRADGVMLGLEARVLSLSNSLDSLNHEIALAITNDVVRLNQSRPYFEAKRNLEELQRFRQLLDMKVASERIDLALPKTAMVEVVDRAAPALRPVSPNLPRALTLILFGVLLGIAGFMMLARHD
jgi:uncharacterized protein involved in exopolysaccharide biosynthesis